MRWIGRRDGLLIGGLLVAVLVLFATPLQKLLDLERDIERASGLALVPALIILTVVFILHQQGKRQESKAQAGAAEAEARLAQTRARELERLVSFGQALGHSLDTDAIREVVGQQLPHLAGTDQLWIMVRADGRWQPLVASSETQASTAVRAEIAERAAASNYTTSAGNLVALDGHLCLPMTAGRDVVGVLAVAETAGPFSEGRQRVLATVAALLSISLRNADLFREVRENAVRDGLTGCVNRTHAMEAIDMELRRSRRSRLSVSLIMFDVDRFKEINDQHGHLCGDAVLAAVGTCMREVLKRGSDLKCRYGGDEFLVLLPETPIEGARQVAETLRRCLAERTVQWNHEHESVTITASFGVTVALPSEIDTHAFIARADAALYQAKDEGRNRVCESVESASV